jgi:hypothetical protein
MGLFDMVMIKDNHISTAGGVTNALKAVDLYLEKNSLQLEVEVVLSFIVSHVLFCFDLFCLIGFFFIYDFVKTVMPVIVQLTYLQLLQVFIF